VFATLVTNGIVTTREELHHVLHPRVHRDAVVSKGHFVKLHNEAREHPCLVHRVEIVHAITTLVAMEVGCIQQMVTKMSKKYMVRKIAVEWLHKEVVASNLT
jgi:hypothetical protein